MRIKTNLLKKTTAFLLMIIMLITLKTTSYAASTLSISTDKSEAKQGETIKVTVTLSYGAGKITSSGHSEFLNTRAGKSSFS